MGPRILLFKYAPLVVQSQVDLRLHRRNVAEGTKATWLEWKISTESGKERVGSIGKGWNIRVGSDELTCGYCICSWAVWMRQEHLMQWIDKKWLSNRTETTNHLFILQPLSNLISLSWHPWSKSHYSLGLHRVFLERLSCFYSVKD